MERQLIINLGYSFAEYWPKIRIELGMKFPHYTFDVENSSVYVLHSEHIAPADIAIISNYVAGFHNGMYSAYRDVGIRIDAANRRG